MERKLRILGIAPYQGMKNIMENVAEDFDDVELDVFIGDMNEGVSIVQQKLNEDYDVIISRGETADRLSRITTIPVVSVNISFYDLLRALSLADNYSHKYAIVGFGSITSTAKVLCNVLKKSIEIVTIENEEMVRSQLEELYNKGYRMVLCDAYASNIAKTTGLNAILVTSGMESISEAFERARKDVSICSASKEENLFLKEILHGAAENTVVISEKGDVFFRTVDEETMEDIYDSLLKELPNVLSREDYKFFKNIDETLYSFSCRHFMYFGTNYAAFYFNSNTLPFVTSKYGIRYTNLQETVDSFFNSFYSVTSSFGNLNEYIENINHSNLPVMITGESGCGKEKVAGAIYSKSKYSNNPMILINCALINDKSWNFLTNHYNSPFNDNNNTIYLENVTELSVDRLKHLLSIIVDTKLASRNRLIFSCVTEQGYGMPKAALEFVNMLSCTMIYLSPLRERVDSIPTLASLYLSTLNERGTNQIVGFENDAMKLMQKYSWPYNFTQFKRILNELSMMTTTPFIRAEDVASVLAKENTVIKPVRIAANEPDNTAMSFNLNRTLDEINREIIENVLNSNGGNQSAAAKQLGISRTTLWRYLKIT